MKILFNTFLEMLPQKTQDIKFDMKTQNMLDINTTNTKPSKDKMLDTAKEFQSLFIQMMIKSMRDANKSFASNNFKSDAVNTWQEFYDQEIATKISKTDFSLAKIITAQYFKE